MDALKTRLAAHFGSETAALSVLPVTFTRERASRRTRGCRCSRSASSSACSGGRRGIRAPSRAAAATSRSASSRRRRSATACWRRSSSRSRTTRSSVAVDHHRAGDGAFSTRTASGRRTITRRRTCRRSSTCCPTPWRGFMMAGFAAAYMSTVATQLNWGASYLVNDFYKRFLQQGRDGEALRRRVALDDDRALPASSLVTSQLDVGRGRVEVPARDRRRHGPRADSALVLVAHQRVVRDQRDDRVVRRLARLLLTRHAGRWFPAGDPRSDAGSCSITVAREHGRLGGGHVPDAPEPDAVLESFYRRCAPAARAGRRVDAARLRPRVDSRRRARVDELDRRHRRRVRDAVRHRQDRSSARSVPGVIMLAVAAAAFAWIARVVPRRRRRRRPRRASRWRPDCGSERCGLDRWRRTWLEPSMAPHAGVEPGASGRAAIFGICRVRNGLRPLTGGTAMSTTNQPEVVLTVTPVAGDRGQEVHGRRGRVDPSRAGSA